MKLYQLKHEQCPNERIYIVTEDNWDELDIRNELGYNDHGGLDFQTYATICQQGTIEEVTKIEQVPVEDYGYSPYGTVDDISVGDFFGH